MDHLTQLAWSPPRRSLGKSKPAVGERFAISRILTFPASGSLPRQNLAKNRRFCPFGATSVVPPTSPAALSGLRNPKLSRNDRRAFPQAKGAPRNGPGSSSGLRRGGPQESLQEATALYGLRYPKPSKNGRRAFPQARESDKAPGTSKEVTGIDKPEDQQDTRKRPSHPQTL